jgi:hypothetical protein
VALRAAGLGRLSSPARVQARTNGVFVAVEARANRILVSVESRTPAATLSCGTGVEDGAREVESILLQRRGRWADGERMKDSSFLYRLSD